MLLTTTEVDNSKTLDGCSCNNDDVIEFNTCMAEVRTRMLEQLDTVFLPYLKNLVMTDSCKNFNENCLQ